MIPRRCLMVFALAVFLAGSLTSCGLIGPLLRTAAPLAGIKLAFSCLPEDAMIDTPSGPRSVREITAGDVVTGYEGKPVVVQQKHIYRERAETEFLRASFEDGASVEACGMHRVAGLRMQELKVGQVVAGRRVISIASRRGIAISCDLMTEDAGYRINGVPVNSMIEEMHAAAAGRPRSE
ncbi:MAG: hypothetical protein ACKV19_08460 [Verrucomicrobiales bacterium]